MLSMQSRTEDRPRNIDKKTDGHKKFDICHAVEYEPPLKKLLVKYLLKKWDLRKIHRQIFRINCR